MKKLRILLGCILALTQRPVIAQINPMGSSYYQNLYLSNPAMVGLENGWEANAAYKAQRISVEEAPSMQVVSVGYGGKSKKLGLGLLFYNDQAGVFRKTSLKGSYAYHLPLNQGASQMLDFGLSAGIVDEWIDYAKVDGDEGDVILNNFNQRKQYFDTDLGVAYRDNHLNIQAAIPNLKRVFNRDLKRNVIDRASLFASASYKFVYQNQIFSLIEPKIVYRGLNDYKDQLDLAVNTKFWSDRFLLNVVYHSSNSLSVGLGAVYEERLSILAMYTTSTFGLQDFSNGEFEVGLKYNFK